jgi:HTH-type transcriptional regulator / antitoxin HigA
MPQGQVQKKRKLVVKTTPLDRKKYGKLLVELMPVRPTSDEENNAMLALVDPLMIKGDERTPEETRLLSMLIALISDYEKKRYPEFEEKVPPAQMLAFFMEDRNLSQRDFPSIPQSRISEILTGKRKISKAQAVTFGEMFNVNPGHFLEA